MCSASTIYSSIKQSGLRPGQWAVFPGGGGGVGIQGVQLAAAMGIRPIVVDTGDTRRKLCNSLGAEAFFDFATTDHVAEVLKLTEGGAHAVFVTAVQSYPVALDYLGHRGGAQVMCIGLPPAGKFHIDLDPSRLVFRNQSVKGTLVAGLADVDETLDFARRGKLRLEPTIVGLSKFNESVQKLKNGQVAGRIVVDFNLP
jgi:propanol-preferring alcohol dehydrogenase